MKIAVVYNRDSQNVINLFGLPNREKYGKRAIQRIVDGLKKYKHQVKTFEADKDLIPRLEDFMPRVIKHERPGMVFNLSYGIQGQARYTHVPGILEMVGIPYVGSGPLAHSLALDKVVAKMIFQQNSLPTPAFAVLNSPDFEEPDLSYPLIVKPKNESVSMGIQIVNNGKQLRDAAAAIFDQFSNQPVLAEQYIEGREINVGLLGNAPAEPLPPCEIVFGSQGLQIYTIEDKKGQSGREIEWRCPAPLGDAITKRACEIARRAFTALGCYDAARVDMRLDEDGNLYILEINSLPSLGEHGSYVIAAEQIGLDFAALVNRMVEAASARYFGTPVPPQISAGKSDPHSRIFAYITSRRDQIEKSLEEWSGFPSRTSDPVGNNLAIKRLDKRMQDIHMRPVKEFTDTRSVWSWETKKGLEGGTLFIGHMDVPVDPALSCQTFRRDADWLYGEGIGTSRGPLVMLEYVLRALRYNKVLHKLPLGVLYYLDEGRDCRYSAEIIKAAAAKAKRVFVLRPGSLGDNIRVQRRGQRRYRLNIDGSPKRIAQFSKNPETIVWFNDKLTKISALSSQRNRLAVSVVKINTDAFPMRLPHRVSVELIVSYLEPKNADSVEEKLKDIMGKKGLRWNLEMISERPPMKERRINLQLAKSLVCVAEKWDIPLKLESSVMPTAAGLVPARIPVVCGVGPVARDHYRPQEAINRTSLVQRTLLMSGFLLKDIAKH